MKIPTINKSGFEMPVYATSGAVAFDIRAIGVNEKDVYIIPAFGGVVIIKTGLYMKIPEGYELQIRARSGLSFNQGFSLCNAVGTIDQDYTGEIKIAAVNHGREPIIIRHGDRVAQGIVAPIIRVEFEEVETLPITDRGSQGFGHTGLK